MANRRTPRARSLRQRQGLAARKVWAMLRGGRCGGLKFRREHAIGPWYADFACDRLRLVIELDGGVHTLDDQRLADHLRQVELEALGWTVLRFTNEQALADAEAITAAIKHHAQSLSHWEREPAHRRAQRDGPRAGG